MTDADCGIGGADTGLVCIEAECQAPEPCQGDGPCVVQVSGWSMGVACKSTAACQMLGIDGECIGVGGQGRCVPVPADMGCTNPAFEPLTVVNVTGQMVAVCGQTDAYCADNGLCAVGCSNDFDCAGSSLPACDTASQRCGCLDDTHCAAAGVAGAETCIMGTCGCIDDQGCRDAGAGDVCVDGRCECFDDRGCAVPGPFDGGSYVCALP